MWFYLQPAPNLYHYTVITTRASSLIDAPHEAESLTVSGTCSPLSLGFPLLLLTQSPPQHGVAASVEGGRNDCQRDSKSSLLSLEVAAGGLERDEEEKIAHP